jgi:hypothetical protein
MQLSEQSQDAPAYVVLYRRAFQRYRVHALWNLRYLEEPSPEEALIIARALRIEGDMPARFLAESIEQACGAAANGGVIATNNK